jgi:hypothetical protein
MNETTDTTTGGLLIQPVSEEPAPEPTPEPEPEPDTEEGDEG